MTVVLDTSALAAVILGEVDAERYVAVLLSNSDDLAVSAATYVEAGIVLQAKLGDAGRRSLDELLGLVGAEVVPVDAGQAAIALSAWARFGRGRHPAKLNLGDCFSYALARSLSAPLLYKGEDFGQTDVSAA